MSKLFARIVDGIVIETCDAAALATHHPDLAATFVECSADAAYGWQHIAPDRWISPEGTAEEISADDASPKKKASKK